MAKQPSLGTVDERELAMKIRAGDKAAMGVLYRKYIGHLSSVCHRYLSDADDVSDVLHDGFLKIFTQMDKYHYAGEGSMRAWATRIVVNRALNFLRERNRLNMMVSGGMQGKEIADDEPDVEIVSPDELHLLIRQLPDGYRTVLNLYAFEDYSHCEIAQMLGIKEATSASQLHHAKALLARKIKELRKKKI